MNLWTLVRVRREILSLACLSYWCNLVKTMAILNFFFIDSHIPVFIKFRRLDKFKSYFKSHFLAIKHRLCWRARYMLFTGRAKVTSEPDNFPWYPESFSEIFYSGDFIKNDGTTVKAEEVKGKVKGVYFSAHWVCTVIYQLVSLLPSVTTLYILISILVYRTHITHDFGVDIYAYPPCTKNVSISRNFSDLALSIHASIQNLYNSLSQMMRLLAQLFLIEEIISSGTIICTDS